MIFNERKTMNTTQQRMAAIFNEWARRYAENPDDFGEIIDADGKPVEDYGQRSALYFEKIADEMDAAGQLPRPGMVPKPGPWPERPTLSCAAAKPSDHERLVRRLIY